LCFFAAAVRFPVAGECEDGLEPSRSRIAYPAVNRAKLIDLPAPAATVAAPPSAPSTAVRLICCQARRRTAANLERGGNMEPMNPRRPPLQRKLLFAALIWAHSASVAAPTTENIMPPRPERIPHELIAHGHTRLDPYYWLRERDNPKVIAYLEAENRHFEEVMAPVKQLREELFKEMVGRIKKDDASVPYHLDGYFYYTRLEGKQEYALQCRKRGSLEAEEEILLNENALATGHDYCDVTRARVSPDDRLLAYGIDTVGRRQYTIRVQEIDGGKLLAEEIPNTEGRVAWAADGKIFFYAENDPETLRPYRVMRHVVGTDPATDVEIFREQDPTFYVGVSVSKSRRYIMIDSGSTMTTEVRYLAASDPLGEFELMQPRVRGIEYMVSHFGDYFYVVTNYQAKNFRLMRAPIENPGIDHWEEVVPHRPKVLLEGLDVFRDYLVLSERSDGITRLQVLPQRGADPYQVEFPESAHTVYTGLNPEFDTDELRFHYTSLITPWSVFDYNMKSKERNLKKEQEVVGGYDRQQYRSERRLATAADGTRVPISIVYRRDFKQDGSGPLLLYGYGSYGLSLDPEFDSSSLSLLDRGFAYAIAHVRGGQEFGREWYEDGRLLHKMNTFTDFIACAKELVAAGYTSPPHLYAIGGSAGGLLMGAVVNMRPDLFHGICAAVPFVDVVTTMLDESIPLTTGEYDEWGNPNEKRYYDYMLSYSPYDNVRAQDYPAMLVTTGLHDSQVQYWEPAKWVARLRDVRTGDGPILLHTDMEAGHSGASGRFRRHKDTAREYAFLLMLEGYGQER
jgi:oligopeptidase B